MENRLSWADAARHPSDADGQALREAVALWVVGYQVAMADAVADDLAPLPSVRSDTARLLLRDRIEGFMRDRKLTMRVAGWIDDGGAMLPVYGFAYPQADPGEPKFDDGWQVQEPPTVGLEGWQDFLSALAWRSEIRLLAACGHCGKTFAPQRRTAIYCSDSCRVGAHVARKEASQ